MKKEKDLYGARVWRVDDNMIPKFIGILKFSKEQAKSYFNNFNMDLLIDEFHLDLENNTYAIRIGKKGLK